MDKTFNNKLLTAINSYLKPKKLPNGIVRISHGAQFSRSGAIAGWFLMLILLIIGIVSLLNGGIIISIVLFFICSIIVAYIMDFKGIEIDTNNGKIRNYDSFMGHRSGVWYLLENFNQLKIYEDTFLEKRELDSGSTYSSANSYDTHRFYTLALLNDDQNRFIKLFEDQSVTIVRIFAAKFAKVSELTLIEKIDRNEFDIIK